MNAAHYLKFLLAVVFALISGAGAALADGSLTVDEAINLIIAGLGAVATYVVPNLPAGPGRYLKLFVQAITAGVVLLASLITDGVTLGEWFQVGAAILGVFTVYAIPNYPELVGVGQLTDGTTTAVYVASGSTPDGTEDGGVDLAPDDADDPALPTSSA